MRTSGGGVGAAPTVVVHAETDATNVAVSRIDGSRRGEDRRHMGLPIMTRPRWEHGVMTGSSIAETGPARLEQRPTGVALALADAVSLVTFVAVGLRSHRIGAIAEIAARNAVPLAVTWIVVSVAVGTYRRRDLSSLAITWAIAVPVALLVRTWWVGSPQGGRIVVFVAVGLAFTLLFLVLGRVILAAFVRMRPVWRRRP